MSKSNSQSSNKKNGKKATLAKIQNKEANKAKRSSYRHEKEIKRAQRSQQVEENPMLSAEFGVRATFNMNSAKAKKIEAKRKRKANEAKREQLNTQRSTPINPANVSAILGGKQSVTSNPNIQSTTLSRAQKQLEELKARAMKSDTEYTRVLTKQEKMEERKRKRALKKQKDDDEESVDEEGYNATGSIGDNDSDSDSDGDSGSDDSDMEFEEPDTEDDLEYSDMRRKMKAERQARQKVAAAAAAVQEIDETCGIPKPKPIPQKEALMMKKKGIDPKEVYAKKLTQWKNAVDRKKQQLAREKAIQKQIEEDEADLSDYEGFFENMTSLTEAPVLENYKKSRSGDKAKEREEYFSQSKRKREESDDDEYSDDDVDLDLEGPDSDDDDDDNETNVFDLNSKDAQQALSIASALRGSGERENKVKVRVTNDVDDININALAQKDLRLREKRDAEKKAKSKLMVRDEDGNWIVPDDDREEGEFVKPDLSAYIRKPKEKKEKKSGTDHIDLDPRNSKALSAARNVEEVNPVDMSVEAFRRARMMRLRQVQLVIADLSQEILLNPEKYLSVGHVDALLGMCKDSDKTVRQLAFVSLTQIFLDIMPGYRIRIPTAEELKKENQANGPKLSKEVSRMRTYEKCLVDSYFHLINVLKKNVKIGLSEHQRTRNEESGGIESSMSRVALNCMCKLFERGSNFNFSREIAAFLATVLTSASETFQETVANTVTQVFRNDFGGDATHEIVKAIAHVFKNKGGDRIRAPLLSVLLGLPLSREILNVADTVEHKKKGKKALAQGAGSHYYQKLQQQKEEERMRMKKAMKTGKEFVQKKDTTGPKDVDEAQLARDMAEGEATISIQQRKKTQSEILSLVMTIYFRYLKQAPTLKSLYTQPDQQPTHHQAQKEAPKADHEGNVRAAPWALPTPIEPPSHLLLTAVLKGISQFAPLINIELVLDLLEHLKQVIGASAREATISPSAEHEKEDAIARDAAILKFRGEDGTESRHGALPLRSSLLCLHTSFLLLKMYFHAITIDVSALYAYFYEMLWQLIIPSEWGYLPIFLECWELMILQPKMLPPARVAALCRRFLIVAQYLKPNLALPIIHAVGLALNKHPKASLILENEGQQNGEYDALIADPDLSHGAGSPAWDIATWVHSYHPFTHRTLAHALALPELVRNYTNTNTEKLGNVMINGELAKNHQIGGVRDEDNDAPLGFASSNITVNIAGEKCALSRLNPTQYLRALDCSKGGFAPDITVPSAQSIAIACPDQVTPSQYKHALSRASTTRRKVCVAPYSPLSTLPLHLADICVGSEPEEIYTVELLNPNRKGLSLDIGIDTGLRVREWLTSPLCLDTREPFDLAARVKKNKREELRHKIDMIDTFIEVRQAKKAMDEELAEIARLEAEAKMAEDEDEDEDGDDEDDENNDVIGDMDDFFGEGDEDEVFYEDDEDELLFDEDDEDIEIEED